jgi:branched-chain amino acid aminotransferase
MADQVIYLNGRFLPAGEASLPLLTHALHYGTGVFEGIRAYYQADGGELLLFRATDHFDRMTRNVKILNMRLPLPPAELTEVGAELIRLNAFITDVYLRPIAFKSATRVGVTLPDEESFALIAVPMGDYLDTHKGLHCGVSSWRRLSDNAIPCRGKICGAYVNSALAAQEARDRGFDEAIFLNEAGGVAEGSAMNLFLVRDGRLVTPDATQGILEGITRDTIITLAREEMGIDTEARAVSRAELYAADEAFLCGTAAQVAPVTRIDGRSIGAGEPGPLTLDLQAMYDRAVRGRLPQYRRWNEPVYRYVRTPDAIAAPVPGGR